MYKYAVIIGIDGMGNANRQADTPNMDRLFGGGAQSFDSLSLYPTISAQNWGAMLIGAMPETHGLTNSIVSVKRYENKELPTIFATVREAFPGDSLCSCSNWDPINYGIIEEGLGVEKLTGDDDEVCRHIERCAAKKPRLMFIQFDGCDDAGHTHGYFTPQHIARAEYTDALVGRIYDAYKNAGIADDTLFIAIADHGGNGRGHGGYSEGERYVYFALAGKTVIPGAEFSGRTCDINAIIRYAFSLPVPSYSLSGYCSQIPQGVFSDYNAEYIRENPRPSLVENLPTPDINGADGLYAAFDRHDIELAMFFDGNTLDSTGRHTFTESGTVKFYSGGRYGSMCEPGVTGFLRNESLKFGAGNFTVSAWLHIEKSLTENCYFFSTKTMSGPGPGFTLGVCCAGSMVGVETDNPDTYNEFLIPSVHEIASGWLHLIFAFDMQKLEIGVYHNFEHKYTAKLPECFRDFPLDALPLTIGEDASGECNRKNNFVFHMDDLLVFRHAFSEGDAAKLKAYYKM